MRIINKIIFGFPYAIVGSILALILTSVLIVLLTFWSFYPYDPIKYSSDYQMNKTSYVQGEQAFYTVDYCKFTDISPELKREFVDGIVLTAENITPLLEKGCRAQSIPILIPDTLPEGHYQLRITLFYEMNPIKTIKIVHNSNWFDVKEK